MFTLIAATATLTGVVAALLPAMQIAKMRGARSSNGISIPYLAGGLANSAAWTVYSFAFPTIALIVPTVLGLLMNITMLTVAVRYRPRRAVADDDELAAEFAQLLAEEHERRISPALADAA